ncbi:MAG: SH3 domain-containing protein [Dokdonia sp.]|nr:SH3 domain-containing protein [Dokdonia sp.]
MKIIIKTAVLACLVFASCTSEKKDATPTVETQITTEKPLLAEAITHSETFITKSLYVNAVSGLSLRESTNLKSKKILTLPYGAQVKYLSTPAHTSMTIESIPGNMVEVAYQGATGFVFNGFLSDLSPPLQDEAIEAYAKRISTDNAPVIVTKKANEKGVAFGQTTVIQLPAKGWNEAYTISKRLFDLPKSISLDLSAPSAPIVIQNANKRTKTLVDEIEVVHTTNNEIDKIIYTYTLKTYGRTITIMKGNQGFTVTEIEVSQ